MFQGIHHDIPDQVNAVGDTCLFSGYQLQSVLGRKADLIYDRLPRQFDSWHSAIESRSPASIWATGDMEFCSSQCTSKG